jgi:hypothetical protein
LRKPTNVNLIEYDESDAPNATPTALNESELKDNLDGCAWSADNKIVNRSALSTTSNKCAHCRGNQKLSFRETNVHEASLKKFSSGQLVRYGFDSLNNAIKAIEELKLKSSTLKEYAVADPDSNVGPKLETLFDNLNKISLDFELFRNEFMPATYSISGYSVCIFCCSCCLNVFNNKFLT